MANSKSKTTFKDLVGAIPQVAHCYQPGKQALGGNASKVKEADSKKLCGSLDLDSCVKKIYIHDHRWDYILCYDGRVYFVEVHPASTSEVETMEKKLVWLKAWLAQHGSEIRKLAAPTPYYWVQSGNHSILKGSPQARRLAKSGIIVTSRLDLR